MRWRAKFAESTDNINSQACHPSFAFHGSRPICRHTCLLRLDLGTEARKLFLSTSTSNGTLFPYYLEKTLSGRMLRPRSFSLRQKNKLAQEVVPPTTGPGIAQDSFTFIPSAFFFSSIRFFAEKLACTTRRVASVTQPACFITSAKMKSTRILALTALTLGA